jgi:hypothetical protein
MTLKFSTFGKLYENAETYLCLQTQYCFIHSLHLDELYLVINPGFLYCSLISYP